ncbi:hypothetical protein SKAU_G00020060 [Synaphobranchus kaupii]|uniref:DDE Tnp4 domain-containing protein n=1 Tax=Synaphobranchus kaupii TaxID=118154 RepID=A0A9Q1GCT2_SYNKA|nr:hypothetical protein SKAU_G00020060 [Synaphobranchus kaupii]
MPCPTEEMWRNTARRFEERWNFPHCIGALDGKHITIQAPPNTSGSQYFNYKGTFSIVLLALVDANYRFLAVDVGGFGSNSDGGIFANSRFGKALQAGDLNVPPPSPLPAPELGPVPYVVVADEAFPMKPYLLRPYPGSRLQEHLRVFNRRLRRWRVFYRRLQVCPEVADSVVKATCILSNFLQCAEGDQHPGEPYEDDGGESVLVPIRNLRGNRASAEALRVRETFRQYFVSPAGQVFWQYDHVHRGVSM